MNSLADKIIFLTGGASGIGQACATAYARAGASLFVIDSHAGNLQETLDCLGPPHAGMVGNVSREADVQQAIEMGLQLFGRLDASTTTRVSLTRPNRSMRQAKPNGKHYCR